jgi:hypothetical protein
MLKKVEAKCKRCKKEFYKKRSEQEFCSALPHAEALLTALFVQVNQ